MLAWIFIGFFAATTIGSVLFFLAVAVRRSNCELVADESHHRAVHELLKR